MDEAKLAEMRLFANRLRASYNDVDQQLLFERLGTDEAIELLDAQAELAAQRARVAELQAALDADREQARKELALIDSLEDERDQLAAKVANWEETCSQAYADHAQDLTAERDAALATVERVREVATANAARAAELRNRPGTQRNAYDDGRAVAYQDAARDIEDALAAPGNFLIDYVRAAAPGEIAQLERLAAMERSAECVSCGYAPCMCDDGTVRLVHGMDSTGPGLVTYGQDPRQLVTCDCGRFEGPPDLLETRDALEAEDGVMPDKSDA
jgi:hypothetical protein